MPQRKRILGILFAFALFNGLSPLFSRADTWAAFGPQTYTRGSGAPVTSTDTITLPHPGTQYTLRIFNGGLEHNHALFVSNCEVRLNGVWIAGPKKCNHKTSEVSIPITPLVSNTLSVTVRGRKGSTLAIEILGVDNDPPTISATIDPPPDAAGWNSSAVKVTFTCADALSGVASCSPPVALSSEVVGKVVTGTATDVAGNTATVSATVNISFEFFKIRSWQTNLPGDPLQTGKCLDYGTSSSGASVFISDCANAHSIRVVEIAPRDQTDAKGNLIALCQQDNPPNPPIPHTFCHEVMLFAGNQVIGIDAPQTTNGGFGGPPTTEYTLTLQTPWTSFHRVIPPNISPADQIFAYDGDSIILESSRPCANLVSSPQICDFDAVTGEGANTSLPPPQFVIQIQNARGANGSPLVAGVRNLADNEFWDFVASDGSGKYPTSGFISMVAPPDSSSPPTPITTNWQLWNAICGSPQVVERIDFAIVYNPTQPNNPLLSQFPGCSNMMPDGTSIGWGTVIVVAGSDPKECTSRSDVGPCIDLTGYPPVSLPPGVTIRGNRRGVNLGPQLFYANHDEHFFAPLCEMCMLNVNGDYARITGLRMRGESRATDESEPPTDGIVVNFPGPNAAPPLFPVTTTLQFIASIDHNDMSDWGDAAIGGDHSSPYSVRSSGECSYPILGADGAIHPRLYPCGSMVPDPLTGLFFPIGGHPATLPNVRIARNFLHHNERAELGYGANVTRASVEGNTFLLNRHDITAGGEPHNQYRAAYNLVLSKRHYYGFFHGGRLWDFDMHGTGSSKHFGGTGGYYVEIVGNTFLPTDANNYVLRGVPELYTDYHGNVSLRNKEDAVNFMSCDIIPTCSNNFNGSPFPIHISDDNQFANSPHPYTNPTVQLGVGDFDGDGTDDLFLATGAAWYYSPGGKAEWRFLSAKTDRIDSLLLGDFDGDGRTDVVGMNPSGQLVVSWGGISDWEVLNQNPCPNSVQPPIKTCAVTDMAVGKFLDHTNGVPSDDLFLADGSNWYLSSGGSVPFSFVNNSSFRRRDVLFGDFDGDGKTDVFGVVFDTQHNVNSWSFTSKAAGDWIFLQAALPSPVNGTVKRLVVANFRGNMIADVGAQCGDGWKISSGGKQGWSGCNTFPSEFTLVNGGVGHFSRGGGADILLWNKGNGIEVFRAGTGPSSSLSTQDMR